MDHRLNLPAPLKYNLTPMAFHHFAVRFTEAARLARASEGFSPVPYYCFCRALELALKAFLSLNGVTRADMQRKALGHDLMRNLAKANELGKRTQMRVSAKERSEIRKANGYYRAKDFEYANIRRVVGGYGDLPDLDVLDGVITRWLAELEPLCAHVMIVSKT